MVVGGGGRATQDDPDSAVITAAIPMQDPERFSVTFTRAFPPESTDFGTFVQAYAVCLSLGAAD